MPEHQGCRHLDSWHDQVTSKCRAFGCDCVGETPSSAPPIWSSNPLPPIEHHTKNYSRVEADRAYAELQKLYADADQLRLAHELENLRRKLRD